MTKRTMPRLTVLIAGKGVQALDITGPASVFAAANDALEQQQCTAFYDVRVISPDGKPVQTNSAVSLNAHALSSVSATKVDTVLIGGHERAGTIELLKNKKMQAWMKRASRSARRWGSVCTGAFVLAGWGLLSGKRAATHWRGADNLAALFPDTEVDGDSLYVVDGALWTSAGVTAGIDMALAMVEQDLGAEIASEIARRLVVYLRRPGSQAQFSKALRDQQHASAEYGNITAWARDNLSSDLSIDALASKAGQSRRTFQRHFAERMGQSPAAFVEDLRLERAKALIATGAPLKTVASETGFKTPERLSTVFQRRYQITPAYWRRMHYSLTD